MLDDLLEAVVDVCLLISRSGECDGEPARDGIAEASIGDGSVPLVSLNRFMVSEYPSERALCMLGRWEATSDKLLCSFWL